jgi:multiple sugar transport system substrate-binding protein
MQVNGFIWQHGASVWDETKAPSGQAEGVVNSPEAVKAFQHYLDLTKADAAGGQDRHDGHLQDRRAVPRGQARLEHPVDRLRREHGGAGDLEGGRQGRLRAAPGLKGPDGKINRWANIGGQPFVLTTWNSEEVTQESLSLVKWWLSDEIQTEFSRRGGASGRRSVYGKPDYVTFRPWNRVWAPASNGRRTPGTCRTSSRCWCSRRRSS